MLQNPTFSLGPQPNAVPYLQNQLLEARNSAAEHRIPDMQQQELMQQQMRQAMLQQHQRLASHQQQQQQQPQQQPAHQQPKPRVANIVPHKSAPSQYSNKTQQSNPYHQYSMGQPQAQQPNTANAMNALAHGDMARPMPNTSSAPIPSQNQPQHHSMDYSLGQHQQQRMSRSAASQQSQQQAQQQMRTQAHEPPSYPVSTEAGSASVSSRMAQPARYVPSKSMPSAPQSHQLSHPSPQDHSPRDHSQGPKTNQLPTNNMSNTRPGKDHSEQQTPPQQMQSQGAKPGPRPASYVPYKMDSMRKNRATEEQQHRVGSHPVATEMDMSTSRPPAAHSSSSVAQNPLSSQPVRYSKPMATRVPYKMEAMRQHEQRDKTPASSAMTSTNTTSSAPSLHAQQPPQSKGNYQQLLVEPFLKALLNAGFSVFNILSSMD